MVDTSDESVRVLAPEEARRLLTAAHPSIVAWFALGLFAGLRPTEAAKLAWNDIGDKFIRVHASIAKIRRNRLAPILDPLPEWPALAKRKRTGGRPFRYVLPPCSRGCGVADAGPGRPASGLPAA